MILAWASPFNQTEFTSPSHKQHTERTQLAVGALVGKLSLTTS